MDLMILYVILHISRINETVENIGARDLTMERDGGYSFYGRNGGRLLERHKSTWRTGR